MVGKTEGAACIGVSLRMLWGVVTLVGAPSIGTLPLASHSSARHAPLILAEALMVFASPTLLALTFASPTLLALPSASPLC